MGAEVVLKTKSLPLSDEVVERATAGTGSILLYPPAPRGHHLVSRNNAGRWYVTLYGRPYLLTACLISYIGDEPVLYQFRVARKPGLD